MAIPEFDSVQDALPLSPAPAAITVRSNKRARTSQSESGHIISRAYGGQFFEATLIYNPMRRDQAAELIAFLQSRGPNDVFKVRMCGLVADTGLLTGNFANIPGSTKLYLIENTSPIAVSPEPATTTGPEADDVYMRASLRNRVQTVTLGRTGLIRIEVDLVERLSS